MGKTNANPDLEKQVRFFGQISGDTLVRRVMLLDATVTGVNGTVYLVGAGALDSVLGLSTAVLLAVGAFLVVFTAEVVYTATRPAVSTSAVQGVVIANLIWAVGSFIVAAADWFTPTTTGRVWIVLQAVTVAAFAGLQGWALRRVSDTRATA